MSFIELCALSAGSVLAGLLLAVLMLLPLLAIGGLIQTLFIEPSQRRHQARRDAADRATAAIARIEGDAAQVVVDLEQAFVAAADSLRNTAAESPL